MQDPFLAPTDNKHLFAGDIYDIVELMEMVHLQPFYIIFSLLSIFNRNKIFFPQKGELWCNFLLVSDKLL